MYNCIMTDELENLIILAKTPVCFYLQAEWVEEAQLLRDTHSVFSKNCVSHKNQWWYLWPESETDQC